jgi:INO80 complex subunit Ies4
MSTSTATVASPPLTNGRVDKIKRQKKIIVLRLPPTTLAQFLPTQLSIEKTPFSISTPGAVVDEQPVINNSSNENPSESNSTPAPLTDAVIPADPPKKRKGPLPGLKRSLAVADGTPKPRGKPGPKKKPRLYVTASQPAPNQLVSFS